MNNYFDRKTMILLILLSAIIFLWKNSSSKEYMSSVSQGQVYLKGDYVKDIFDLSLKEIKEMPTIEEEVIQTYEEEGPIDEITDVIWEGKKVTLEKIVTILEKKLNQCNIYLNLKEKDVVGITDRKRFVQLLPLFRKDIKEKVDYDKIKCFVTKYDVDNFIGISKVEEVLPRYLQNKNMIMVNDFLYQFTPYGTLKYKLPIKRDINSNDSVVVGSLESTLINDIHKYNDSNHVLIPYKGKIFQIINNQFVDIRSGVKIEMEKLVDQMEEHLFEEQEEEYIENKILSENNIIKSDETPSNPYYDEFIEYKEKYSKLKDKLQQMKDTDDNDNEVDDEMGNKINQVYKVTSEELVEEEEKLPESFFNTYIYLINHSDIIYIVKPKQVKPNFGIGEKINLMIKKHNVIIRGVIPNFYFNKESKFQIEYLFLCNNDFFFRIKDDTVSDLIDFKKTFGFSISKNLKYEFSCQEYQSVLDQLVIANKITNAKKIELLKRLKCTSK